MSDMEPYATDKGEVLGVVDVVTLQPIDRDGDGIILEGTDEERFVGQKKSDALHGCGSLSCRSVNGPGFRCRQEAR